MPRHDRDAIAALAEGRLDPDEAAALEREIAADPIAAAELAAHRIALDALSGAPRPELSVEERSTLRAAVADALGVAAPEPGTAQPVRRVPWGSLGIAAAALLGLVAIVPVVGLLSTDGDNATAAIELPAEATTTAAAAAVEQRAATADEAPEVESMAVAGADADDALIPGGDGSDQAAAFGSSTTLRPTTTTAPAAAPTTTQAAAEDSTTTSIASATGEEQVAQLSAELSVIRSDAAAVNARAADAIEETSCWIEDTEIRSDPPPQRFFFEYENGELTVVVYFELTGGEVGPFQVWGVPDCADLIVIP